jgi:hypothetical protein
VQPAPVARSDAAAPQRGGPPPTGARGDPAQTIERGVIAPVAPAANARSQRDLQEQRPPGQKNVRSDPRRVAPVQSAQPAQAVQPGQPGQATQAVRPEQGVRVAPPAPAAAPLPVQPGQPAREEVPRGRSSKDADERDDRQPPSQERRRDPRQQQNQ